MAEHCVYRSTIFNTENIALPPNVQYFDYLSHIFHSLHLVFFVCYGFNPLCLHRSTFSYSPYIIILPEIWYFYDLSHIFYPIHSVFVVFNGFVCRCQSLIHIDPWFLFNDTERYQVFDDSGQIFPRNYVLKLVYKQLAFLVVENCLHRFSFWYCALITVPHTLSCDLTVICI